MNRRASALLFVYEGAFSRGASGPVTLLGNDSY